MYTSLQILTLFLVAIAFAQTLAHALEMPGKMRLSREAYLTVQPIYYPGFTIAAAFGEFGGMLATTTLLVVTPADTTAFRLVALALAALVTMHVLYWAVTHRVNKFWLRGQALKGAGATFFSVGGQTSSTEDVDWRVLRNRWEYSHVTRAALTGLAFILLATAVALS